MAIVKKYIRMILLFAAMMGLTAVISSCGNNSDSMDGTYYSKVTEKAYGTPDETNKMVIKGDTADIYTNPKSNRKVTYKIDTTENELKRSKYPDIPYKWNKDDKSISGEIPYLKAIYYRDDTDKGKSLETKFTGQK